MAKDFDLCGKVALVTGAGGDLGKHFCETLTRAGARVVLVGRSEAPLREVAEAIREQGGDALVTVADIREEAAVKAAFAHAWETFGTVDVVLSNAGTTLTREALDISFEQWRQVLAVNLDGCWLVAREAARRLEAASLPGSIILVSSILGHRVAGQVLPYTVSKAAVEQMARALALEWARHGIRVNALAPGYIETDLNREFFATQAGQKMVKRIPLRRLGQAAELDGALLLLASEAGRYITGSSVVVDGGHLQSTL